MGVRHDVDAHAFSGVRRLDSSKCFLHKVSYIHPFISRFISFYIYIYISIFDLYVLDSSNFFLSRRCERHCGVGAHTLHSDIRARFGHKAARSTGIKGVERDLSNELQKALDKAQKDLKKTLKEFKRL